MTRLCNDRKLTDKVNKHASHKYIYITPHCRECGERMQRKKHPKNVQLAYIQFKEETINFHLFLMTSYFRKLNTD